MKVMFLIVIVLCVSVLYVFDVKNSPKTLTVDAAVETLLQGFHSTATSMLEGVLCKCY